MSKGLEAEMHLAVGGLSAMEQKEPQGARWEPEGGSRGEGFDARLEGKGRL